MGRPFQFRLRTAIAIVSGLCLLLGFLRWLGPDAVVALVLLATMTVGALLGSAFRRPLRGMLFGAILPVVYVLSIPVVEHVGRRARWPGPTWSYCEAYEALWYRKEVFGSATLWREYWLWDTWCDVMRGDFGSDGPVTARLPVAFFIIFGTMLCVRRRAHAAFVVPAGIITGGFTLAACHDFDAAFLGLSLGGLGAILADRRKSGSSPIAT